MAPTFPVAPRVGPAEEEAVLRVLRSGQLAAGPEVAAFESEFAAFAGTRHAVAASSGTAALHMALVAAGVGPGDEVIVPALTFVASANAVVAVGATPVFADIAADGFALSPDAAACAATERTRAVMAVHLYGIPADVGALSAMCAERSLSLIEDAAQAHGASWDRRPVGSWGIGAFSFYATKNMTTGEGGIVTTGDDEVAGRARSFANHGRRAGDPGGYAHPAFGLNLRMTDLAAAIGRVQLACLEEANAARRHLAALLTDVIPEAWRRPVPPAAEPVWHLFPLVVDDRDEVIERLQRQGVPTGIFYPAPVYRMAPHLPAGHCPVAESLGGRLVCLRIGAYDEPTRHRYAEAVASALGA